MSSLGQGVSCQIQPNIWHLMYLQNDHIFHQNKADNINRDHNKRESVIQ